MSAGISGAARKHDPYSKIDAARTPKLSQCPVCGCDPEAWRFTDTPESTTTVVVMCTNAEEFEPQCDSGCALRMPPVCFYQPTIREAAGFWNGYAAWLIAIRNAKVQP